MDNDIHCTGVGNSQRYEKMLEDVATSIAKKQVNYERKYLYVVCKSEL